MKIVQAKLHHKRVQTNPESKILKKNLLDCFNRSMLGKTKDTGGREFCSYVLNFRRLRNIKK